MKTIEKTFFLILAILIGIGLLEGCKAFLGFVSRQWGIIVLIDVVFLLFLFIYQVKRSVFFGILASILASFLLLSLLTYSWNLFLLIPILGIMSIKNKNQKWQIKSTGLSSAFSGLKKWNISLYYPQWNSGLLPILMLVIDKIKTQLSSEISLQTKAGLFFSAFDLKGQLLASNGVMKTDRTIEMLLQSFYLGILKKFEPQIKSLIFDVVEDIRLQNDPNVLIKLPLDQYGLFLVEGEGQNSGVLLPNTKGINTIQEALAAIKKKYNLNNQVSVFIFRTKKILINL